MDRNKFNLYYAALLNAFPNQAEKHTGESQDVYWSMLKELPDDLWEKGVAECLKSGRFFPTINELGEASVGEVYKTFPHNPHNYRPKIKLGWVQGLAQIQQNRRKTIEAPTRVRIGMTDEGRVLIKVREELKLAQSRIRELEAENQLLLAERKTSEEWDEVQKRSEVEGKRRILLKEQARTLTEKGD